MVVGSLVRVPWSSKLQRVFRVEDCGGSLGVVYFVAEAMDDARWQEQRNQQEWSMVWASAARLVSGVGFVVQV